MKTIPVSFNVHTKPALAKVMVYQPTLLFKEYWERKDDLLYYPKKSARFYEIIHKVLDVAESNEVDLILFPELFIPESEVESIRIRTENSKMVVVAGSHYTYGNDETRKPYNTCPVIYKGKVHNVTKKDASKFEEDCISSGDSITVFTDTPVGDFSVIICSDYLSRGHNNVIDEISKHDLDFWIVAAMQPKAEEHHAFMSTDIVSPQDKYILYANMNNELANGGSAVFAILRSDRIERFIKTGVTDHEPRHKAICPTSDRWDYFIVECNLENKRPKLPTIIGDAPNVKLVAKGVIDQDQQANAVTKANNSGHQQGNAIDKFHEFVVDNYLMKGLFFKENESRYFFEQYAILFKHLLHFESAEHVELLNSGDVIEGIADYVVNSTKLNPMLFSGYAGCGKTPFLSVLYWNLFLKFKRNEIQKLPIYINLNKYNKHIYRETDNFLEAAKEQLNKDLDFILDYLSHNPSQKAIFIVDGADEYNDPKVDLDKYIDAKISSHLAKQNAQIIGLRIHRKRHARSENKKLLYPGIKNPQIRVTANKIKTNSEPFPEFVDAFSKIASSYLPDFSNTEITSRLLSVIQKYRHDEIDIFLMTVLLQTLVDVEAYLSVETLSAFYSKYFQLKAGVNTAVAGELAFKVFHNVEGNHRLSPAEKNQQEWWIIQNHESVRDYFVANRIVDKLKGFTSSSAADQQKVIQEFNKVYPYDLNVFCKEIINEDLNQQYEVLESIKLLLSSEDLLDSPKPHLCYLLGRFKDDDVREIAIEFLLGLKPKVKKLIKSIEWESGEISEKQKKQLLYYRTIFISLIYLGNENASNEYISELLSNKYFDKINRGFHLEYYQDIPYHNSEFLKSQDNLNDFPKTFAILYDKLNASLDSSRVHPLFSVELYTLCSLAQHRHVRGSLDTKKADIIVDLIQRTLKSQKSLDHALEIYLNLVEYILAVKPRFKRGEFVRQMFKLKEIERTGWIKRRTAHRESVAAHTLGGWLLGMIHLPQKFKTIDSHDPYDKETVLKMILIHDLGESITGDVDMNDRDDETDRNELKAMMIYSLAGTFDDMPDVQDILTYYIAFTDKANFNAQVANDLDKLDMLLQLHIYNETNSIPTFEDTKRKLIKSITTRPGARIKDIILELYE
ncbi:MAG: HD domain-containing protein [Chitinophagaceae bacterium]|nr:MAG: HD domain-containing protein [Chitinophagaceae bacterium]